MSRNSLQKTTSFFIPLLGVLYRKAESAVTSFLFQNSFFISFLKKTPVTSVLIIVFFFSLSLPPNFNFELSTNTALKIDNEILDQRQYGVSLYSLANLTLIFLSLIVLSKLAKKEKFAVTSFDLYFLLFLVLALFSVINSVNFDASFTWLLKLFFGIFVYFVFSRIFLSRNTLIGLFYSFIVMIFIQGFFSFFQFLQGGLLGTPVENTRNLLLNNGVFSIQQNRFFRVVGTLSHPSSLGAFIGLLTPMAVVFSLTKHRHLPRFFSYLAITFCLLIQLLALSRWGLVTTVFSIFLTLVLISRICRVSFIKYSIHLKLLLIFIVILSIPILSNRSVSMRFSRFSFEDPSLSARLDLITQALSTIKERPLLGVGGGNFVYNLINNDVTESKISETFPAPVHNTFLLFFSELGLAGLLFILGQIILIIFTFKKRILNINRDEQLMAIALFSSCMAFFLDGLWDARGFSDRVGFLYFFNLGLLVNILRRRKIS